MTAKNEETELSSPVGSVSSQLYRPMLLGLVFVLDWFLGHIPSLRMRDHYDDALQIPLAFSLGLHISHLICFSHLRLRVLHNLFRIIERQMRGYTHPGPGAGHAISDGWMES